MAKDLLEYKTMTANKDGKVVLESKIFNAMAFAKNVHVGCHTDVDFAKSVVTVYNDSCACTHKDSIVAYFCFPRLGMAVALRPGDILIFNPNEYHSVSSRCRNEDEIYCSSMYLKTAVVSLNDNSIPLTAKQEASLEYYNKINSKK